MSKNHHHSLSCALRETHKNGIIDYMGTHSREQEPLHVWAALIVFLSAYSPLALIIIVRDIKFEYPYFTHPIVVLSTFLIALISIFFLCFIMTTFKGQHLIEVKKVEPRSNDLINYALPYLACFLQFDWGKWQDVSAFLIFLFLLFWLSLKTNCLFINPILALMGYRLYEIGFNENNTFKISVILSNVELYPNKCYRMDRITRFLCVVNARNKEKLDDGSGSKTFEIEAD